MSEGTWLDSIPSHERRKAIERLTRIDPKLREKLVVGPERAGEIMRRNEELANLNLALQTEPVVREALKKQIEKDMDAHGVTSVLEQPLEGNFDIAVAEHPQTHNDQLVLIPEGNVGEAVPLKPAYSDRYVSQFSALL
ncbi:hypothetical protein COU80_00690 [Candidatus Peregrinibacteria bacterium CG10_big_fil_rev_8_21_14_0_10_55_24]|nr:MAG: hypothetical protein COU80_00690 [Candidatus Peregrinibacteria bacterium CG10_big_fil_rev_8_21_14_0_10_55_24]